MRRINDGHKTDNDGHSSDVTASKNEGHKHSWSLRPQSYDKTSLRPASVLVLYKLYFWSWSCIFDLGLSLGLIPLVLLPTLWCRT